jgi:hypothetical protein
MAVERPPNAMGFMFRIKMKDYSRDFAPVSTLRIRTRARNKDAQVTQSATRFDLTSHNLEGRLPFSGHI